MPNPYKYTDDELRALVEEWHLSDDIEWDLDDYLMWHTRFTPDELEAWRYKKWIPFT